MMSKTIPKMMMPKIISLVCCDIAPIKASAAYTSEDILLLYFSRIGLGLCVGFYGDFPLMML